MTDKEIYNLKFPIGEFTKPAEITKEIIATWIEDVAKFPERIEPLVNNLTIKELNYRYRPNGWTLKQVVHHCADSHMNSLIRFKLALTEELPTIRPYFEDRWAELPDSLDDDLTDSLQLLKGLHAKLATVMTNLTAADLKKQYVHPEHGKKFCLEEVVGTYAWHSNHHLQHLKNALAYQY
ncbi:YfiT family bacillithiol transferase [Flavicella sediminum]|uniref:YfiT family bacillithiol transferase n=1 Tax=Flavicella sediminum TaxID=2585141 RepID=UPI00111F9DB0|nr:putative metal-dependent hydrolase [Flavicella sediminum]